jgi:hypothetical protein
MKGGGGGGGCHCSCLGGLVGGSTGVGSAGSNGGGGLVGMLALPRQDLEVPPNLAATFGDAQRSKATAAAATGSTMQTREGGPARIWLDSASLHLMPPSFAGDARRADGWDDPCIVPTGAASDT